MADARLPVPYRSLAPALRDRLAAAGLDLAASLPGHRIFNFGSEPVGVVVLCGYDGDPLASDPTSAEPDAWTFDFEAEERIAVDKVDVPGETFVGLRFQRPLRAGQLEHLGATPDAVEIDGESMEECFIETHGYDIFDEEPSVLGERLGLNDLANVIASWPVSAIHLYQVLSLIQPSILADVLSHPSRRGFHVTVKGCDRFQRFIDSGHNPGLAVGLRAATGLERLTLGLPDSEILSEAGQLPGLRTLEFADRGNLMAGLTGFDRLESLTIHTRSSVNLDPATYFPQLTRLTLLGSEGVSPRPEERVAVFLQRQFSQLTSLILGGTRIDRATWANLAASPGLSELRLSFTSVETGAFVGSVRAGGLADLEIVAIGECEADHEVIEALGSLVKLRSVLFSTRDLRPGVLEAAVLSGGFKRLESLTFHTSPLAPVDSHSSGRLDNLVDTFASLPALETLEVIGSGATEALAERLAVLRPDVSVHIDDPR